VEKYAIISDIHGNYPALSAVHFWANMINKNCKPALTISVPFMRW